MKSLKICDCQAFLVLNDFVKLICSTTAFACPCSLVQKWKLHNHEQKKGNSIAAKYPKNAVAEQASRSVLNCIFSDFLKAGEMKFTNNVR